MTEAHGILPPDPAIIAQALPGSRPRVLLFGAMGSGKSTLAAGLARHPAGQVRVLSADPGSPSFGVPGAVNLGQWGQEGWQPLAIEPLCTLDAARFRLPLVQAVACLAGRVNDQMILVDAPGVVRGVAGAELLRGLAAAADIDVVVLLETREVAHLRDDLAALGCPVIRVRPAAAAHRPARGERERRRTVLWDAHLAEASRHEWPLDRFLVTGTPPPLAVPEAWLHRQVALLDGPDPVAMGEIVGFDGRVVVTNLAADPGAATTLLIRDAQRTASGTLATAPSVAPVAPRRGSRDARWVRDPLELTVNGVDVRLVNGLLGDPLVQLRLPNVAGGVLLDLGDAAGLSVKALHGVSDVFISHGHIDHIGGFPMLLRARLSGDPPPCRIYGPPGLAEHIAGFVAGIRWDRIGDTGPVFLVAEAGQDSVRWSRIQPGRPVQDRGSEPLADGLLLDAEQFRVRFVTLDHGIPVLAFLLELPDVLQVQEPALAQRGLSPGPWLGQLKRCLAAGEPDAWVTLPNGHRQTAAALGEALLRVTPGTRIAYATDLAATESNRRALCDLARQADLLICESAFLAADAGQARATGHLTASACLQIAHQAGVARLLPFHFSRRYTHRLSDVADELLHAGRKSGFSGELVGLV